MLHFPPPPATPALLPAHQGAPPHIAINRYVSAREVYRAIGPQQFEASEVDMHIVYSHIVQLSAVEETANPQLQQNGLTQQQVLLLQTNQVQQEQHPGLPPLPVEGNTWIVVWSGNPQHQRTLEMMVAVTQGRLGPHPIFVVAPAWSTLLAHEGILSQVAHELLQVVQEPDRVISIFGE
ncbi:hypothetical protein FRB99_004790 [Tulasnella sp. 403]|nr:hypothetical protein FRB99_004790 [Tulasnella sp. 403]